MKRIKRVIILFIGALIALTMVYAAVRAVYPEKYSDYINQYSEKYNLDPYLVKAIIKAESNFKPYAVSHKNARGLMQISEITGAWAAEKLKIENYSEEMLFDAETNISFGCWYLSVLYTEFGDTELVLAAYNAGSGNVSRWLKDKTLSSDGKRLDKIPFKETENYLSRVKNNYKMYKILY